MRDMKQRITYRITGKQSVERLEPLLPHVHQDLEFVTCNRTAEEQSGGSVQSNSSIDFVWETFCEKPYRDLHNGATVLNRLHNSTVLESKSNFAYVEHLVSALPMLRSFIVRNKKELMQWTESRWEQSLILSDQLGSESKADGSTAGFDDWWALKVSAGNGGRDVHIMNCCNYKDIVANIHDEEMVLQRYIARPLLYQQRKFHFRCYALLMADMTSYLHRHCFILTSSLLYYDPNNKDGGNDNNYVKGNYDGYESYLNDLRRHITNLSINKKFPGHPGQIPCDMVLDYPEVFQKLSEVWTEVVRAVTPYMREQRSNRHFDFYGLDVICDNNDQKVYIIEFNRLPGLESSALNKEAEDKMYDKMMLQLLRIVLKGEICRFKDDGEGDDTSDWIQTTSGLLKEDNKALVSNILRWKCAMKSLEKKVLAISNLGNAY